MDYFDYRSKTAYGEKTVPLKEYQFLLRTEVAMDGGASLFKYFFFYRVIDGQILEFLLYVKNEDETESGSSIIGKFNLKEPFRKLLLKDYLRQYIVGGRNFIGLGYTYIESPVFTKEEFREMQDDIMADLMINKYLGEKKWKDSPIVRLCEDFQLGIHPTPNYDYIMDCRCPVGHNHRLTINAKTCSWYCGYCSRKGYLEEFKEHINQNILK